MTPAEMITFDQVISELKSLMTDDHMVAVAVAGAPGSGKTTLASALASEIGPTCCMVPMDGFHLDNNILEARGMLAKKGAPETFDRDGFAQLIDDLKMGKVKSFPTFDRDQDCVIEDGGMVSPKAKLLVFEGNYLLFDEKGWADLAQKWDASIWLDVNMAELEQRLIQRWLDQNMSESDAITRAQSNDLVNAKRVVNNALPSTWVMSNEE